jgi:hypothetical protein
MPRNFITEHYDDEVLESYDAMRPYSYEPTSAARGR